MSTRGFDAQDRSAGLWPALVAVFFCLSGTASISDFDQVSVEGGEPSAPPDAVANRILDDARASFFIENRGQVRNPDVRFYIESRDFQGGFAGSRVLLKVVETAPLSPGDRYHPLMPTAQLPGPSNPRAVMLQLRFEGANIVFPRARDPQPHLSHFFLGSDAAHWQSGVRSYGEVVYEDLYQGVNLIYHATPAGVKYEFHLRAGATPEDITLVYDGADNIEIDGAGNARIHTPVGSLADSAPIAYQGADHVPCAFVLRGPRSYGVRCQGVDGSRPLVIDPVLSATFLGGQGTDRGNSIAVDADGNAYVTGATESVDFPPTPGSFDPTLGGRVDTFVAKLDRTLRSLIYMTYLGGVGEDSGLSIGVDTQGVAYVAGTTNSTDFPRTTSQSHSGETDAFVASLNASGARLLYATYLGGRGADRGNSLAVGPGGSVLLTGDTSSDDFPFTMGAYDTALGGASDAFVAKVNVTGGALDYATYLGGSGNDSGLSIAVDSVGNAYVTGQVDSADFPVTAGVVQASYRGGPWDAFVAKVNPAGTSLVYATFLGGSGVDDGSGIAVDGVGNAYVTGSTMYDVTVFPTTPGAYDTTHNGNWDVFVAEVDPTGTALLYSTFLGYNAQDVGYGIAVDGVGNAYVVGRTNSDGFPTTPDAISRGKNGAYDGFVARLSPGGDALNYSTFLGGLLIDFAKSIALDSAGSVYVTGETDSPDLPVTAGAWDLGLDGTDAFVAKFAWPGPLIVTRPEAPSLLIWIVLAVTIGGTVLVSWLFEFSRRSFWIPFLLLWARLRHEDILDNKKRGMVVGYLAANPAANFAAIRADLKMAMGTLTYHLWVLEKEGEIKSWRDGRLRRYAPSGHRVAELQPRLTAIELLLLQRIRETAGLTQKELAKEVGVSQPAVSYHISRMAALGVLHVERRGRAEMDNANLDDVAGETGSEVHRGDIAGSGRLDESDDWGRPR